MKRVAFIDLRDTETHGPFPSAAAGAQEGATEPLSIYLFKKVSRGYELERVLEAPEGEGRPSPAQLAGIKEFYLGLPLGLLSFRLMRLPFSDRERLQGVIPFELEGLIMEGLEGIVFDAMVLGGSDGAFEVLVPYIRREILKGILARLASQGIDPQVVTCLDLRALAQVGAEEAALALMHPVALESEERVAFAKAELLAPSINLRTGPFAYTKHAEKMGKALKVTLVLSLLFAFIIHLDLTLRTVAARREATSLRNELRSQYVALFPGEKRITDELLLLKSHLKEIQAKADALMDVDPLQFLLDFSQRPTPGVVFFEVSLDQGLITLKGEASSMEDIDRAKGRLKEMLKDLSISEIKPTNEGKFFFTALAKGMS